MIKVDTYWDSSRLVRFSVSGHAGYAKAGTDIVCAAVSALVYNAINSCEQFLNARLEVEDDGNELLCVVPIPLREHESVQLLLGSMVFGVEQTAAVYPKHIRLKRVSVRAN